MTLKEVLDKTIVFFKDKKIESARLDAELLFASALKLERIQLYMNFERPLKEEELTLCREMVKRRVQGEPIAYILGYKYFYGHAFKVTADTLIPRPETEELVEFCLSRVALPRKKNLSAILAKESKTKEVASEDSDDQVSEAEKVSAEQLANAVENSPASIKILDLGTGTGCIGLTLVSKIPRSSLTAVDISAGAVEVFKKNCEDLQLASRVEVICADAGALNLSKTFDWVVGNPPYIAENDPEVETDVKKFEPSSALFSNDQGLYHLKQWSTLYSKKLSEKGMMIFEMGRTQGDEMKKHFESLGVFHEVRVIKDLSGHDRFILGVK